MDDEIVFLGSSNGPLPDSRPVTGVVLHVDVPGPGENYSMTFRRVHTSVVHIGRRPGIESSRSQDLEQGNAMFRCAVVSRKHAKIAFSDSGHAYLIDLCSHHGTFVRKTGERFSRKLEKETPTMLADGDVITFGKSVGKGDECVRPIVARIELLHAGKTFATPLTIKPLVVPSASTPTSSGDKSTPSKPASSGGRYGINKSPSSSSDESYMSHSDIYSDIEEIPPPTNTSKPALSASQSQSQSQSQSSDQNSTGSLGQAFSVLKRLLPPTHSPSTPGRLPSVTEIVERPLSHVSSFLFGPGRSSPGFAPGSPGFTPGSPFLFDSLSPNLDDLDIPLPLGYGSHEDDLYDDDVDGAASTSKKSRSNSPMDLASPSPAPEVVVSRSLSIPPPVASPPICFSPSPIVPVSSEEPVARPGSPPAEMNIPLVNSPENSSTGSGVDSPVANFLAPVNVQESEAVTSETEALTADILPASLDTTPAQLKQFEESLATLKTDVAKLQSHRRKYKARFNSNVHVISQKLSEFDDRLSEVNAEYLFLANQVDNIVQVEVPDLNDQLETMQEHVDEFIDERKELDKQREDKEEEKEKAMNVDKDVLIRKFDAALEEMKEFAKSMHKQMMEELAAVKAVREATTAHLERMQEEQASKASETPVLTSLKRKRDDIDENEDGVVEALERQGREGKHTLAKRNGNETAFPTVSAVDFYDINKADIMRLDNGLAMDFDMVPSASLGVDVGKAYEIHAADYPRPRKRIRRLASLAAQTATAVTIGAVVTWSALAFS